MRSILLLSTAVLSTLLNAQTTVTTGAGNAQQSYYNLLDGSTLTHPLAEWDLAFEINGGFSAGVLVNTATGMAAYQAPYAIGDWAAIDTTGLASTWAALHNSDTAWGAGALNQRINGEFDLGWGQYNMITHVVSGDSLYVLHLADGSWRKLRIDALAGGIYSFTFAALDGSGEQSVSINKADYTDRNFAYFSFATGSVFDREPPSNAWDLLFTKYLTDVGIWYGVTGVLQNKGVRVLQVDGLPPGQVNDPFVQPYSNWINTIGYDWKSFNMNTFMYEMNDSLTYFVQDVPGNIWKLVFTAYGGSSTGDISFNKELVSAAAVGESHDASPIVVVYPNPATTGIANVLIDVDGGAATLRVIDRSGRIVLERTETGLHGATIRTVDVGSLAPGLYAIMLDAVDQHRVGKLIVE